MATTIYGCPFPMTTHDPCLAVILPNGRVLYLPYLPGGTSAS